MSYRTRNATITQVVAPLARVNCRVSRATYKLFEVESSCFRSKHTAPIRKLGCRETTSFIPRAFPGDVADKAFEPELDPLPALAFVFVFSTYFVVQYAVQKTQAARERRRKLELDLREARLKQLDGQKSAPEVTAIAEKVEEACSEESRAAEVFSIGSLKLRIRVPAPTDSNTVSRTSSRKRSVREGSPKPRLSDFLEQFSRDTPTALFVAISLLLIWSILGMASDPMASPPDWLQDWASSM
mmetsp:Transcript_38355/g.90973  ORF Transcript_38355/g.90973 Transcript_38355/m.90973 type:complete len:242 (-) Transcript_38355:65-790(-)